MFWAGFYGCARRPFSSCRKRIEYAPLGVAADAIIVDIHAEATSENKQWDIFAMEELV